MKIISYNVNGIRAAIKKGVLEWLKNENPDIICIQETKANKDQVETNLIVSGDYNICHKEIDIHDPVRNKTVSGFLPEERDWLTSFIGDSFIDSFRFIDQSPDSYSWWSYRAGARKNNKGWRIDYNMVSKSLEKNIKNAYLIPQAVHSDHCPVAVELKI